MKFDEILNIHDKENRQTCMIKLSNLGDKLFGENNWEFIPLYESETNTTPSGKSYYITIGEVPLTSDCNKTEVNKAGYVYTVKDMYHEQSHVWINTKAWNDRANLNSVRSYKRTTNIVRREFVKSYFPSVYTNNYSDDPGEMDAERYGIRWALSYFDSDSIVTKSEAEEILYQFMMADDYIHSEMLDLYRDSLKTIYDVLDLFEERASMSAGPDCGKYEVTMDIDPIFRNNMEIDLHTTDMFLHDKKFKEYRKAFDQCNTSMQQDKVLEQAIVAMDPDAVKKAPPRLCEELLNCRRQMELDTLKPGIHAISPNRINYSAHDIEELELTEEDLATIPADNETMLI